MTTAVRQVTVRGVTALCLLLSFLTVPAWSEVADTPEGCSAIATAHRNSCIATTVFACESGFQSQTYNRGSLQGQHYYSDNWQVQGYEADGLSLARIDNTPQLLPLSQLFTKGWYPEEGQFALNTSIIKNRIYTLEGETTLGVETATFSDTVFRLGHTKMTFAPKPGGAGLDFDIEIFVSADPDLRLEGNWTRSAFGSDPELLDQQVRAVYFDGDAGFMQTMSEYGCE